MIPAFDGAYFSQDWNEALLAMYYTGAPPQRRYSINPLRWQVDEAMLGGRAHVRSMPIRIASLQRIGDTQKARRIARQENCRSAVRRNVQVRYLVVVIAFRAVGND
jgi:hypothetical protein